jgi:hypothetical protein
VPSTTPKVKCQCTIECGVLDHPVADVTAADITHHLLHSIDHLDAALLVRLPIGLQAWEIQTLHSTLSQHFTTTWGSHFGIEKSCAWGARLSPAWAPCSRCSHKNAPHARCAQVLQSRAVHWEVCVVWCPRAYNKTPPMQPRQYHMWCVAPQQSRERNRCHVLLAPAVAVQDKM